MTGDRCLGRGGRIRFLPVPQGPVWRAFCWVCALAAFGALFMEWIFFATKPSFMSVLTGWNRTRLLLLAPLPLCVVSGAVGVVAGLAGRLWRRARGGLIRLGMLWPALILASSFLLVLDNFTYTLFRFGSSTTIGAWRYGYLAAFVLFWVQGWRLGMEALRWVLGRPRTVWWTDRLLVGLCVMWGAMLAGQIVRGNGPDAGGAGRESGQGRRWPNILLLTPDGLSAEHLSVYGYARDTTPFIRSRIDQALVCENAFPNATTSGGSLASLLTGKLPTVTRLYYPPEILRGNDAYEHLPGVLRQHGYYAVDISVREQADPYDLNLLDAFHEANGRREPSSPWQREASEWLGMLTAYFLNASWERLRDRLLHVSGVKDYVSAYETVVGVGKNLARRDSEDIRRIERLLHLIQAEDRRPFFAHVHLLSTHGPKFRLKIQNFSAGRKQAQPFEPDFYDDAIREFDATFQRIVTALDEAGELDKTIVILTSDHGKQWAFDRIPLLFWFPQGVHAGRIRANTQNLDIAPTLLAFLNMPQPKWMTGVSLLAGEPPADRVIFGAAVDGQVIDPATRRQDPARLRPPFYSLGRLHLVKGNQAFTMNLALGRMQSGWVGGHTRPTADENRISPADAWKIGNRHLKTAGYDVPVDWHEHE